MWRIIDAAGFICLACQFSGSWTLQGLLRKKGLEIGRLHVATLMKKMGIGAIYGRSRSQIYSCLL